MNVHRNAAQSARAARDRELFQRIAGDYARKDLLPASRIARAHRLRQTLASLDPRAGSALLEIGCGAGFAASYLEGSYKRYVGIDHSEALIAYAKAHNDLPGTDFHAADVDGFENDESFDLIFMIGVLHHVPDPAGILARLRQRLRPGGVVAVNEPHGRNPLIGVARAVRKRIDKAYSGEQVEYSAAALKRLFEEAGYRNIRIKAQGLLSTPFAEVVTPLQAIAVPLSRLSCAVDTLIERYAEPLARQLSWNLIAHGTCGEHDGERGAD